MAEVTTPEVEERRKGIQLFSAKMSMLFSVLDGNIIYKCVSIYNIDRQSSDSIETVTSAQNRSPPTTFQTGGYFRVQGVAYYRTNPSSMWPALWKALVNHDGITFLRDPGNRVNPNLPTEPGKSM